MVEGVWKSGCRRCRNRGSTVEKAVNESLSRGGELANRGVAGVENMWMAAARGRGEGVDKVWGSCGGRARLGDG